MVALSLIMAIVLVGGFVNNQASAQIFNDPGNDVMIVGFWAVEFGNTGVSTEFSIFADRTGGGMGDKIMPVQIIFVDDNQKVVTRKNDVFTAFERKHYNAEALVAGSTAKVGFFLVADSNQASSSLSGTVVIGLDPGGKRDGKANLLLDSTGKTITTAQALTAHTMAKYTGDQLEAPLGLTTCPDGTVAACTAGLGFQTFLVFLNAGTFTTVGATTPIDNIQTVGVEFYGDGEVFLGSCDYQLTAYDMIVTRPGLDAALGALNDPCTGVDLTGALVGTSQTTARWSASIRSIPDNQVLVGIVATVNVASAGGVQAYAYDMSYSAEDTSTLHHTAITRLLFTTT
jgi:hypothetical protein